MIITATLLPDEIKEILTEHIETRLGRTVTSVELEQHAFPSKVPGESGTTEVRAVLQTEDHPPLPRRGSGKKNNNNKAAVAAED